MIDLISFAPQVDVTLESQEDKAQEELEPHVALESYNDATCMEDMHYSITKIVLHPQYDLVFSIFCLLDALVLILETTDSTNGRGCLYAHIGFTFIFLGEIFLKCVVYGLSKTFRGWLSLDAFVVVVCITQIWLKHWVRHEYMTGPAAVCRSLRIFRPFRLFEGGKRATDAIVEVLPATVAFYSILALFLFIWAILGMQLFEDSQYSTYDTLCLVCCHADGQFSMARQNLFISTPTLICISILIYNLDLDLDLNLDVDVTLYFCSNLTLLVRHRQCAIYGYGYASCPKLCPLVPMPSSRFRPPPSV